MSRTSLSSAAPKSTNQSIASIKSLMQCDGYLSSQRLVNGISRMEAVQPEILVDGILTRRVVVIHTRHVSALVRLAISCRILEIRRLGPDTWLSDRLREDSVRVEQ